MKNLLFYFKRLLFDIRRSYSFFRYRRFYRNYQEILISVEIKNFDKPNMYISPDLIFRLIKRYKIDPRTLDNYSDNGAACIGFSPKHQKWYGWSHRAIYGFSIGDVVSEGDMVTVSGYTEEFEKEFPEKAFKNILPIGFEAKTLEDTKKMAIAFASRVS